MIAAEPHPPASRWQLYGLSIDSPFALPGAMPSRPEGTPDLTIRWSPGIARVPGTPPLGEGELPSSARDLQLWEDAEGASALVWPGEIGLHYAPDGRTLDIVSRPEKLAFLPTVLVGVGLGWLLQRRGRLCLHGTAFVRHGRAIGVLGPSGAGKSTLAATMARRGAALLTDDVIVLRNSAEGPLVEPGCTSIRMLPDTVAHQELSDAPMQPVPWIDKQLWRPDGPSPQQAVLLDQLVLLRPLGPSGPPPSLQRLSPELALPRLAPHWYPPQLARRMTSSQFRQVAEVAQQRPVQEVPYAHTWQHLEQLADLLMAEK